MRYQVQLTRGMTTTVYGTYSTRDEAERQAQPHAQSGYWSLVEIVTINEPAQ